jgi:hypothetical protein
MNDLSFLTILTLISVTIPGVAQIIQRVLISFIYLDALQTEKWLVPLFFKDAEDEANPDHAVNSFFEQNGFQSMNIVKNLGSTFVYLIALLIGCVALIVFKVLSLKYPK